MKRKTDKSRYYYSSNVCALEIYVEISDLSLPGLPRPGYLHPQSLLHREDEPSIETEHIAEVLVEMFSRVGVPDEMLTVFLQRS